MRKAMICVSALLAMFQLWPLVFGHGLIGGTAATAAHAAAAAAPKAVAAIATDSTVPRLVEVSTAPVAAPKSCYRQYQAHFARCSPGDQACRVKAADDWDLCEATGMWPQ